MTMKDVEHRGNAIGDRLSHFFFCGWRASTVSRAVGSWPGQRRHTGAHKRNRRRDAISYANEPVT